ncbi:MAG: hypothetical protein AB7O73_08270 [Bacteroidia bacterium]
MYDKDQWNKLTKEQQMSVTSSSIRGAIINAFIYIESLMAGIVITVDFNGDYSEYYKVFRPTNKIVEDFLNCYDNIKIHADKYFTDKEALKIDVMYLADIRNRAAHFLLLNDSEVLSKSDPFQNIYFYSIRKSKDIYCTLTGALVRDYQNKVMEFVNRFGRLHNELQKAYNNAPPIKNALDEIATAEHIKLKSSFPSLRIS